MKPKVPKVFASHLWRVLSRALVATALLWIVLSIPLPAYGFQLLYTLRVPIAIFLFIVYIGKLLYDTLFFDHYRP